jgi:hypothetical protein
VTIDTFPPHFPRKARVQGPHSEYNLLFPALLAAFAATLALTPLLLRAQGKPELVIDEDCQTFAVSRDSRIVYAVPRIKRVKKVVIERDDVWIASLTGKARKIVEVDKFMPVPPPSTYIVNSLAWSPDGRRIAMNMTTIHMEDSKSLDEADTSDDSSALAHPPGGGSKAIALLEDDGREVKVQASKTRFIENAINGAWLTDGSTLVYLNNAAPYKIMRVRPSDGQTSALFEGHTFDVVLWDTSRNQAFAVGHSLSLSGKLMLLQLDLEHETVQEIASLEGFEGELSLSPSGTKLGYFEDGDTIAIRDLANPQKPVRVRAGHGRFEWGQDERQLLLKRGPDEKSGDLVWVGIYDGAFEPALHDLTYCDFEIMPGGKSVAVTEPGKKILKVFAF